jgi:DNA-3-methyladenine glycosylase I
VIAAPSSPPDGLLRCPWPKQDPLYVAYHDEEWGVPEFEDRALYEKLVLDGFQAGLSWITILRKRENFRRAFDDFDPEKIARYSPAKIARLMADPGIVRNRAKIEGTILSARAYLQVMDKGPGFSTLLWDFLDGAASSSWGRPSFMPSCRQPAWSTITCSPATAMRNAPGWAMAEPTRLLPPPLWGRSARAPTEIACCRRHSYWSSRKNPTWHARAGRGVSGSQNQKNTRLPIPPPQGGREPIAVHPEPNAIALPTRAKGADSCLLSSKQRTRVGRGA